MQELTFFTEQETDKSIKVGICALVGKISPKISSHKGAWAHMLWNQLKNAGYENAEVITSNETDWNDYDVILIDHGMEFKGTFNIFGGSNDDLYHQLMRLFTPVRKYSLHHDMPDIGNLIKTRLKAGTDLFKTLGDRIEEATELCQQIKRTDHIERTEKLCFGDSHSFGMYQAGYMCQRHDGLTMHGTLKRGLDSYVYPWITSLTVYLGNIDVRHHLMRQSDPEGAVDILMEKYETQLKQLQSERGVETIEIVQVLPIEDESRVLPKTGYYKGTPFYGSWEERTNLVKLINYKIDVMCTRNNWQVYKHPEVYFNDKGQLTFDVMEKPKSVHISREFYRWDMEKNCPNPRLKKQTQSLF
jgi:hypothetical protein